MSYKTDANDDDNTYQFGSLGQELLKQNLQNGYIPNSGIAGVMAQMFQTYLNGSMANPNSPLSMAQDNNLPTLGTMYGD